MRMYYLHSRRKERRYMKQWLNPLSVTQGWAAQVPVPWPFCWEEAHSIYIKRALGRIDMVQLSIMVLTMS